MAQQSIKFSSWSFFWGILVCYLFNHSSTSHAFADPATHKVSHVRPFMIPWQSVPRLHLDPETTIDVEGGSRLCRVDIKKMEATRSKLIAILEPEESAGSSPGFGCEKSVRRTLFGYYKFLR